MCYESSLVDGETYPILREPPSSKLAFRTRPITIERLGGRLARTDKEITSLALFDRGLTEIITELRATHVAAPTERMIIENRIKEWCPSGHLLFSSPRNG